MSYQTPKPGLAWSPEDWDNWRVGVYTEEMKQKKRDYYHARISWLHREIKATPGDHMLRYELEELESSPLAERIRQEKQGLTPSWD